MDKLLGHQGRKTQGDCHVNGARLSHTGPDFPTLDFHHKPYSIACQLGTTGNTDSSKEN